MDNYPVKIGSLSREKVQILIEDAIDWAHVCLFFYLFLLYFKIFVDFY